MLTQALQSVQETMQATGQSPAQLTGPNQNLAQAAQGVVSGEYFFHTNFTWILTMKVIFSDIMFYIDL